ncbi:MAG: YceD family protein [Granulosicoccus sp.]
MKRLSGILSSADNDVQVTALFSRRKDHILISGMLNTEFALHCQRCLEPMSVKISESFELVFVENEEKASELPQELDPVVLDENGHIHVVDLFEDELILHLPNIPKHSDLTACKLGQTEFGELAADVEEGKPNPFEALKNLNIH